MYTGKYVDFTYVKIASSPQLDEQSTAHVRRRPTSKYVNRKAEK